MDRKVYGKRDPGAGKLKFFFNFLPEHTGSSRRLCLRPRPGGFKNKVSSTVMSKESVDTSTLDTQSENVFNLYPSTCTVSAMYSGERHAYGGDEFHVSIAQVEPERGKTKRERFSAIICTREQKTLKVKNE